MKFSIVVPTMWKYPPFIKFLEDLVECSYVSDIVIINNNESQTPEAEIFQHSKILMSNQGQNVYVNPAFNQGVSLSQSDSVCLLNDDVIFDLKVFPKVAKILSPHSGVVGICPGLEEFKQPPITSGAIEIIPWRGQHTFGFGCLMFVHKAWWIDIPPEFVLYYGDNWIFDTCLARNRQNYLITDALFKTPYAATCKDLPEVNAMLASETDAFRKRIAHFRWYVQEHNKPAH